ncbi:MAG: membrane protein insertion efficiency factor YidD [Halieaceae bacterium]|nr:membrane protein insertion efficiency factor YidD [Halieaceae bacterium]
MNKLLVAVIRAYQWCLSPWLGMHCRFHPTCSNYAIEALQTHGALRGSLLSARRLCHCHPWHEGGLDPVPPKD